MDGKPVGFFPALPNFNEALIHANGLRYPWNYLAGLAALPQTAQMRGYQKCACAAGILGQRRGDPDVFGNGESPAARGMNGLICP